MSIYSPKTQTGPFRAVVAALALSLTACQTAPLVARDPARETPLDDRTRGILRNDAYEVIGLYSHLVFLELARKRIQSPRKPGGVTLPALKYNSATVSHGIALYAYAVSAVGILAWSWAASAEGSGRKSESLAQRIVGGNSLAADADPFKSARSSFIGGTLVTSSVVFALPPSGEYAEEDPFDSLHLLFRRKAVRKRAQAAADAEHAEAAARFETEYAAEVNRQATELAQRVAVLFRMSPMETVRFGEAVQKYLEKAVAKREEGQPATEVRVGIGRILYETLPFAEDRIRALGLVLAKAGEEAAQPIDLDSRAASLSWLESTAAALRAAESDLARFFGQLATFDATDAPVLRKEHGKAAEACHELAEKLDLHATLVRAGGH